MLPSVGGASAAPTFAEVEFEVEVEVEVPVDVEVEVEPVRIGEVRPSVVEGRVPGVGPRTGRGRGQNAPGCGGTTLLRRPATFIAESGPPA